MVQLSATAPRSATLAELPPAQTQRPNPAQRQRDHLPAELRAYSYDDPTVNAVLGRYGIASLPALIGAAAALSPDDRQLDRTELTLAAHRLIEPLSMGHRFALPTVERVLRRNRLGSVSALIDQAAQLKPGARGTLSELDLQRAAERLNRVVPPNDVPAALARIDELRHRYGLRSPSLGMIEGVPMRALELPSVGPATKRICITAGVHGDEPCGVAAALLLVEQLMEDPQARRGLEITVIPMVNWRSLSAKTRRLPDGRDLNRTFAPDDPSAPIEARLVDRFLASRDFTHGYDLHSGGASRNGHWLLHVGEPALYSKSIRALGQRYPLLRDHTAPYRLSEPGVGVSSNGRTLKGLFIARGAHTSATLEAPGSVSYLDQVLAENSMTRSVLRTLQEGVPPSV